MRAKKVAVALLAISGLAVALHLPFARPYLRRIGGCPVPSLSRAQIEAAQARAFHKLRGKGHAAMRPALDFKLEETTLADVKLWASGKGISCETKRDGALLVCPAVPAARITYDEMAFGFRLRDGRLVNITTLRTGLAEDEARSRFSGLRQGLEERLGPPEGKSVGGNAYAVFRFSNYLAEVSAMPLPRRGYALREHYMSALE